MNSILEYFPVYFLQSTLQEKGSHESFIADLHRQLKELRQENDMLLEKLQVSETGNSGIICMLCLSHKVIYYLNSETGHHNNQQ